VPQLLEEGDVALQLDCGGSMISSLRTGTVSRRVGLILISQISSGTVLCTDAARADELLHRRIVGEQAVPKDNPRQSVRRERWSVPRQEASTCSTRIGSRFEMNLVSMPEVTLAAPHHQDGPFSHAGPRTRISAKVDMGLE